MTAVAAARITSAAQAHETAARLAAQFAVDAARRDSARELPHRELDQLSASGLLAVTVPAEFGGADLAPAQVAEVFRLLAAADPNIAQIPHSHFVYLNLLRLAGTRAQRERYFGRVLAGARIANAQSERTSATIAEIGTTVRPADGEFRIDGTKFYCTGSLFADLLAVLTRLDDPDGRSGLDPGEYIAFLPADTAGVTIVDDWNGIGQRTTGSGTVTFDAVRVTADQLIPRAAAVRAPTGYGAFAQLLHVAIDVGIARGALDAATDFVRTKSRPWFEAGVDRASEDPLVIQRIGELAVTVAAAEATFEVAGRTVDHVVAQTNSGDLDIETAAVLAAEASIAVATAKITSDRAANEVSAALFEVSGTRSAAADLDLDRFWRNARTHTLHDPVRWKYQHIGRAVLNGTPPPLHGVV
ncbi:SfnB family sulfur acquisition oxidoreductase [Nocardia cerradoensis]|uniref:Dibenzothiophene desulfurization enzyme C n=1 Tax=Nocardia cerradoensis TaxID=85688 RepID=A0A231HDD3_9NOCA|nr:SfnB family sulfur acquisition oxidoreductase [Nocardia cerradoensis]NKY47753.1 SfnB family sulfur acquisition oxidoreductase [Nocardia cerradoensis]OXR46758.1 Dibenzothiophene desulfurization enzyme C [Nocardia cerradoensis]